MVKVYFKGGAGITNPTDKDGIPIKEGDILTHSWWSKDGQLDIDFWRKDYPSKSKEDIEETVHKPSVIVRFNKDKGYYWGEGLTASGFSSRLYLHDFCFKETKRICHISENPKLYVEKFSSVDQFLKWLIDNEGKTLVCYRGFLLVSTIEWKYIDGEFYTKDEDEHEFSLGMQYSHMYYCVDIP